MNTVFTYDISDECGWRNLEVVFEDGEYEVHATDKDGGEVPVNEHALETFLPQVFMMLSEVRAASGKDALFFEYTKANTWQLRYEQSGASAFAAKDIEDVAIFLLGYWKA